MRSTLRIFAVATLIVFLSGCTTFNPATGRNEFIFVSTNEEIALGQSTHAQIVQQYQFSQDPIQVKRLETIGQRVAQVSDRQDFEYKFFLVAADEINAFTTPGGYVYFFEGLWKKLKDDEIAAVIAHEIGHNAARHTIKKYQAVLGYTLLAELVIATLQNKKKQQIAALSATALFAIVSLAYSRKDEHESDRLAVKYLNLAGYDPYAMVRVLRILETESKDKGTSIKFLRTHPVTEDRIKVTEAEIKRVTGK